MVAVAWDKSEFCYFYFLSLKIYASFLKRNIYLGMISEFSEPPDPVEFAWMSLSTYLAQQTILSNDV